MVRRWSLLDFCSSRFALSLRDRTRLFVRQEPKSAWFEREPSSSELVWAEVEPRLNAQHDVMQMQSGPPDRAGQEKAAWPCPAPQTPPWQEHGSVLLCYWHCSYIVQDQAYRPWLAPSKQTACKSKSRKQDPSKQSLVPLSPLTLHPPPCRRPAARPSGGRTCR